MMNDDELSKLRLKQLSAHAVSAGAEFVTDSNPPHAGTCPRCDKPADDIATRRLNTAYHEDDRNWLHSCRACWEDTVEYYRELWQEVYR